MYTIDIISNYTTIRTKAITKIAVEQFLAELSDAIDIDRIIVSNGTDVVFVAVASEEIHANSCAIWRSWTITLNDCGFDLLFEASGVTVDDAPLTSGVTANDEIEDVDELEEIEDLAEIKTVTFGHYEGESIEWIVLEERNDERVLISAKVLDTRPYNAWCEDTTWETCDLRTWLNEEFFNTAFNAEEQAKIVITKVTADTNPDYITDPGNDTEDKVWLLSIAEANRYFANDDARKCAPTRHDNTCWWWLRSPGSFSNSAALVYTSGRVSTDGNYVDPADGCVRPVVVIKG